jgi:NNP family nitrate/nitrite transporter-like MFS transporter
MGIAGAGNSGTALAALIAPSLAVAFGWTNVFGLALIPLIAVFILYLVLAKDAPECPAPKSLAEYSPCSRTRTPGGSCSSTR